MKAQIVRRITFLCAAQAALIACGSPSEEGDEKDDQQSDLLCTEPEAPPCEDTMFLELNLQDDIAPGLITSTPQDEGWLSEVDATAGGPFTTDPDSYVYARFTDEGLVKVGISDEDALGVMEWDIAFRRYVIRINSGDSGPGCTLAAAADGDFESVQIAPAKADYLEDDFYTDAPECELLSDNSGLPESPATALHFWSYPGCVQMTGQVYVLKLRTGEYVKLEVTAYYSPSFQEDCQADPDNFDQMQSTGSANIRLRWAFLS